MVINNNNAPSRRDDGRTIVEEAAVLLHYEADPLRHLTVQIPQSLRRNLKLWAAAHDKSVREVVEAAIRDKIGK